MRISNNGVIINQLPSDNDDVQGPDNSNEGVSQEGRSYEKSDRDNDRFGSSPQLTQHERHELHERKERVENLGHQLHEMKETLESGYVDDPTQMKHEMKELHEKLEDAKADLAQYKDMLEDKHENDSDD